MEQVKEFLIKCQHLNLMHFAMYQKHWCLYPGPKAIEYFNEELRAYKISKGTIQMDLNSEIPKLLIEKIVNFNVEKLKNKKNIDWKAYNHKWEKEEEFMQQLIVKTNLDKTFKWGTDVYSFNGKNVIAWGGFKEFFSVWFYNGVFLRDDFSVLVSGTEGKTKSLRQWRFTSVEEMFEEKIIDFINQSIQVIKDGKEIKPVKEPLKKLEGVFKEFLDANTQINSAFLRLTPGKQKEYMQYIEEAKQEKTKKSRLEKIESLILEGKGLNDKYKK